MGDFVVEAVAPLLKLAGLKKHADSVYTLDLSPGILGWFGLNRATRHRAPGEVEINPVVGVRFQEVEQLVSALCGEKFHSHIPPTVSSPLGYVMPDARYRGAIPKLTVTPLLGFHLRSTRGMALAPT